MYLNGKIRAVQCPVEPVQLGGHYREIFRGLRFKGNAVEFHCGNEAAVPFHYYMVRD